MILMITEEGIHLGISTKLYLRFLFESLKLFFFSITTAISVKIGINLIEIRIYFTIKGNFTFNIGN